jgi:shikimate dehydrogenase
VESGEPGDTRYDIAINATSLGMQPGDALPMADDVIARSALVAECVVAPEMTRLLEVARVRGRPIHTDIAMLSAQIDLLLRFMGVT